MVDFEYGLRHRWKVSTNEEYVRTKEKNEERIVYKYITNRNLEVIFIQTNQTIDNTNHKGFAEG